MMKKFWTMVLALSTIGIAQAQNNWTLDKGHTNIGFVATHMMLYEVEGEFGEFDGTVTNAPDDFNGAEVKFTAQAASVNTDNERRDGHLKGDDFFNVESFPQVKFDGKIQKEGNAYFLVGAFTMRDITKQVKFDVKYNGTIEGGRGRKAGFKVTGSINRFDYGLKWDKTIETGGFVVAEDIQIICSIALNEKKEG